MKKNENSGYYTNRHSCFLLCYHIVLVTKFRHPVLTGCVKDRVYEILKETIEERGHLILEMGGEPDHVHLLIETKPDMSPQELINVLKTRTSRLVRKEFSEDLAKYYWKPYFWSDSYFVATVGENTKEIVTQYIQNQ